MKEKIIDFLFAMLLALPTAFCVSCVLTWVLSDKISIILAMCFYLYEIISQTEIIKLEKRIEKLENKNNVGKN